jgi:hypothetical protein
VAVNLRTTDQERAQARYTVNGNGVLSSEFGTKLLDDFDTVLVKASDCDFSHSTLRLALENTQKLYNEALREGLHLRIDLDHTDRKLHDARRELAAKISLPASDPVPIAPEPLSDFSAGAFIGGILSVAGVVFTALTIVIHNFWKRL